MKFICFIILLCSFGSFAFDKMKQSEYPFANLTSMKDINTLIRKKMIEDLGMKESEANTAKAQRIFTSDWFAVNIRDRTYVIDNTASYWLESDLDGMFALSPSISRVNVSNNTRGSLVKLMNLAMNSEDILPRYKRGPGALNERVYAFVDLSCPHCREFHLTQRAKWQSLGIDWVYIPFSRDMENKKMREMNVAAFCQQTPEKSKAIIDEIYLSPSNRLQSLSSKYKKDCSTLKKKMVEFFVGSGERYGFAGSPMFLTETGRVLYGVPAFENYMKSANK